MKPSLTERLSYHVMRAMPHDWIAHKPLVFEGNQPGHFIARISGDYPASNAVSIGRRYYEIEGYGTTPEAALEHLLSKLG